MAGLNGVAGVREELRCSGGVSALPLPMASPFLARAGRPRAPFAVWFHPWQVDLHPLAPRPLALAAFLPQASTRPATWPQYKRTASLPPTHPSLTVTCEHCRNCRTLGTEEATLSPFGPILPRASSPSCPLTHSVGSTFPFNMHCP